MTKHRSSRGNEALIFSRDARLFAICHLASAISPPLLLLLLAIFPPLGLAADFRINFLEQPASLNEACSLLPSSSSSLSQRSA